jgi:uncharacterized phage protein (TIGR02220 family)
VSTIKRTIRSLEEQGLLLSENWNTLKIDKTKWYSIDYEKFEILEQADSASSTIQSGPSKASEWDVEEVSLNKAIPEITTEKISSTPFSEIIQYLNEKTNKSFKAGTKRTKELIQARFQEGNTLGDFQKVIDLKAAEWMSDPQWNKYLRPETLFGTKFESYLNQESGRTVVRAEDFNLED